MRQIFHSVFEVFEARIFTSVLQRCCMSFIGAYGSFTAKCMQGQKKIDRCQWKANIEPRHMSIDTIRYANLACVFRGPC